MFVVYLSSWHQFHERPAILMSNQIHSELFTDWQFMNSKISSRAAATRGRSAWGQGHLIFRGDLCWRNTQKAEVLNEQLKIEIWKMWIIFNIFSTAINKRGEKYVFSIKDHLANLCWLFSWTPELQQDSAVGCSYLRYRSCSTTLSSDGNWNGCQPEEGACHWTLEWLSSPCF